MNTTIDTALGAAEAVASAFWVGASAGFAFISAPTASKVVTDLDAFATLIDRTIARTTTSARVAGTAASLLAAARSTLATDGDARANDIVRCAASLGAVVLLAYHQQTIVPRMDTARRTMGSFATTPEDDPRRIAYRAEHQRSTRVYGAALLLGVATLVCASLRD